MSDPICTSHCLQLKGRIVSKQRYINSCVHAPPVHLDLVLWAGSCGAPLTFPVATLAMAAAAGEGRIDVMEWLEAQGEVEKRALACNAAIRGGHVQALQWLKEHGCESWKAASYFEAGSKPDLLVLKWRLESFPSSWPDTKTLTAGLAAGGHSELLFWAVEKGCLWDEDAVLNAASSGYVEILKWFLEVGKAPRDPNLTIRNLRYVKDTKDLSVLEFLSESGVPLPENFCTIAARMGLPSVLEWSQKHGGRIQPETIKEAVNSGRLEVVQWLWENEKNVSWKDGATEAADRGHTKVLKFVIHHGASIHPQCIFFAARNGDKNTLKWWHNETVDIAVQQYFFHRAQKRQDYKKWWDTAAWAARNGAPRNTAPCHSCLVYGDSEKLQFLRGLGFPWQVNSLTSALVYHLQGTQDTWEAFSWAIQNGAPMDSEMARITNSYDNGNILQWLVDHGCPLDSLTRSKAEKQGILRLPDI